MCERGLFAQCETTQNRAHGKGASLFGYTELYGSVPGGQAEYLRVPQAHFGPIVVPDGPPDERFLYLSDCAPNRLAGRRLRGRARPGARLAVLGLGPIGQFAVRVARHLGVERVIGVDLVAERLALAQHWGAEVLDCSDVDDVAAALIELTDGRGPDSGRSTPSAWRHTASADRSRPRRRSACYPSRWLSWPTDKAGPRPAGALRAALKAVRRGGTVSVSGVYGGEVDPLPMMEMFDRGIQLRMGQAHVRRWSDDILPLLLDDADPLGCAEFATHHLPLAQARRRLRDVPEEDRTVASRSCSQP